MKKEQNLSSFALMALNPGIGMVRTMRESILKIF
jgi:hypothetical protein